MSAFTSITLKSTDIDRSKFTVENHNALKSQFPELDDDTIARYLIARGNDLSKATELLGKAQRWKAMHYPILKQDCLNELSKGIVYTHGVDKEGRPLFVVRTVNHDPRNRSIEELAKAVLWMVENLLRRLPDDKSKYTILIDRTDAGVFHQDVEFIRHFSKLFQDQHPERLHRAIVYPSGMVFWSLWSIVKWFVDPVTRDKVCPVMYLAGVQEFVDDDNIPSLMVSPIPLLSIVCSEVPFSRVMFREASPSMSIALTITLTLTLQKLSKKLLPSERGAKSPRETSSIQTKTQLRATTTPRRPL